MTGLLAALILLIENQDILFDRKGAFTLPAWRVYRKFLFAVLIYYATDILWGILESRKLSFLLFADTSIYFIAMAAGVLFWTQYVVAYLDEDNIFGRILIYSGRFIALLVVICSLINLFTPVLFRVDADSVYHPLETRYVILVSQIILLLLISLYAFSSLIRLKDDGRERMKYRTIGLFGLTMAVFLILQVYFAYLPLYSIAFMLGTCLLRSVVIGDEKEKYRSELEEAEKIKELKQSISALLDNMPALSFSKDAETGVYLACNQAFAEYAHKDSPDGVVGLTDAKIFDRVTASHFVEDDHMALSMDEPYIFYEDVPDAAGNQRQFQTTKLKFMDAAGRLCILGMCQDVTDTVRIQRENATTKEAYEKAKSAGIIFTHIAQTLARGYADLYYVNIESGDYIEYHSNDRSGMLAEARRGGNFFDSCQREAGSFIHPDDCEAFRKAMERDALIDALNRNKTFFMTYRLLSEGGSNYVSMKVYRMEDDDRFIVIGITDVDDDVKDQKARERMKEERIAYSRINSLTGDFLCVYTVDPLTGYYREFSSSDEVKSFETETEGADFFEAARKLSSRVVCPEDVDRFMSVFTRESVMSEIDRNGIFIISYRLMINGKPNYVRLKAAMVDEEEGKRLIVGINDIDSHVRREEDYARRLAKAQYMANIDELTGVKSRHAYLDEEERLDHLILENHEPEFAIVILDVNDLKIINDTMGHQAGDQYIRDACKIICDIFKRSPVFRLGGDEFAVIVQGEDYRGISELTEKVREHNEEATRNGGVIIACGMSEFQKDDCVAAVFERADQNMYADKSRLKEMKDIGRKDL